MQELNLYEYSVIQLKPRVERGEYMNVGLVLLSKPGRWIKMEFHLNHNLFSAFCPEVEKEVVEENLKAFREIAHGSSTKSPIAKLDPAERFRWLTAVRSSIIQTSRPHTGKSRNLEDTFYRLFKELVL